VESTVKRTETQERGARRYATDCQIAEIYEISVLTLRRWRLFGKGPTTYKIGRCVRYDLAEVEQYVRSTASDAAPEVK
jgi:hypothetical protein